MSQSYLGNQPNQGLGLPDVQVKDNVVFEWIADGVEDTIEIDLSDFLDEDFFELNICCRGAVGSHFIYYSCDNIAFTDPQTIANDRTATTNTTYSDVSGYIMVGEEGVSARVNGMFQRSGGGVNNAINYKGWDSRWSSGQQFSEYSVVMGSVSPSPVTKLRMQHKQKTGLTVAPFAEGTHILITIPKYKSKEVVYANGQSIQKNYLHNTGNLINQRGYVFGTPVTTVSQALTDRWLANANPSSISYSTVSDPELMTIVGGIYQGIEKNDLAGKVCVLHWEGTAQGSVFRANGDVSDFKDSPIVFTMPTDVGITGAMEYATFGAGTLKHMKLEVGEVPTKWEPEEVATQLNICQRFFQINNFPSFVPVSGAWRSGGGGTIMESPMFFRGVEMRAVPAFAGSTFSGCDHVRTADAINAGSAVPYLNYNEADRWNFRSTITGINSNFYNVVPTAGALDVQFDAEIL